MSIDVIGQKDGFVIRLAKADDAVNYYEQNYCPLDKEVARLTGCKEEFSKDEVVSFFLKSLEEDDRYFFLIIAPDGEIIGESVINEIDWELKCANFRIGLYRQTERGKGIGTWATDVKYSSSSSAFCCGVQCCSYFMRSCACSNMRSAITMRPCLRSTRFISRTARSRSCASQWWKA